MGWGRVFQIRAPPGPSLLGTGDRGAHFSGPANGRHPPRASKAADEIGRNLPERCATTGLTSRLSRSPKARGPGTPILLIARPTLDAKAHQGWGTASFRSNRPSASTARAPAFSLSSSSSREAWFFWPWERPFCAPRVSASCVPACLRSSSCPPPITSFLLIASGISAARMSVVLMVTGAGRRERRRRLACSAPWLEGGPGHLPAYNETRIESVILPSKG